MTAPRAVASRNPVSIRSLVLLFVALVAVYVIGFAAYLAIRVGPAAATLRGESAPVLELFGQLSARADRLDAAISQARRAVAVARVPVDSAAAAAALDSLRHFTATAGVLEPTLAAAIPAEMRRALARSQTAASNVDAGLQEVVAHLALGDAAAAATELAQAEADASVVGRALFDAQRIGLGDLIERERQLGLAVQRAIRTVVWWVAAGALLVAVLLLMLRRRIQRPLADLETALEAVARGDLNARIHVRVTDELGRVALHFNEMTTVLRTRAEEQGRFAAAGQLIAGVAHEVNNPLMAIAALADTRLEDSRLEPEMRGEMMQIRRQARRAGKLLSGLLRFVRSSEPRVTSVGLNTVVRNAIDLVSYRFGVEEITLQEQLDGDLPPALGVPARLEQVFVNLLSNAVDAMRGVKPPRTLRIESWSAGGRVQVAVADTGPGIAAEMAPRLFHPFATTKGVSGTGLGLYISRQIMREAGGDLEFEPRGAGARFVVWLPASPTAEVAEDTMPARPPASAAHGLEGIRVLVVDDEDPVRQPIARFLVRRGAEVREARDGREALEQLERFAADVVLADLRMPRMSGVELHAHLARHRPELAERVVILSGDLSQLGAGGSLPVPAERVLAKPVELKEIEAKVRDVARYAGAADSRPTNPT